MLRLPQRFTTRRGRADVGQGRAGGNESVITLDDFQEVPARARGAFLAVGNFDGVHLGHSQLIGRLRANADAAGAAAIALTFDPHPVAVLRPESAPAPLVWTDRKVELLKRAGATEVGVFQTGPWLLGLTAREFFDRVIVGQFGARGMVEGPNFAFGRDRGGDANRLGAWCKEAGLEFEIVTPTEIEGDLVSSSRIRRALGEGKVEGAARLLGRPYRLRGLVTHGAGRGAGLGFPTANLDEIDTLIPADGVYAALATIAGDDRPPARPRPTSARTSASENRTARSNRTSSTSRATSTARRSNSTSWRGSALRGSLKGSTICSGRLARTSRGPGKSAVGCERLFGTCRRFTHLPECYTVG